MCENQAKDNPQNWWASWGVVVKPAGTNKFNVLSRNDYSTLVSGYLLLLLNYSTLHCMIPNPNKVLCDPVENEKYALYIAFEGKLPKENSGTGAGFDYYDKESDTEEVNATIGYYEDNSRRGKHTCSGTISEDTRKSVQITEEWLFDSGATVHVTSNKHLLFNTSPCKRLIKVANGGHMVASLIGDVLLKSRCGSYLMLKRILYSPKFNKNIICAPQMSKNHDYIITMKKNYEMVHYKGTVLKVLYRASANLYFFKGVRLPESDLKYLLYLNKEKKKLGY
jgi:hypothetical protein